MASDKDIKINFKTSADTSGAKAAEDAIKKVAEAGKESGSKGADFNPMVRSQAELDAHIEKTNQAADAAAAHDAALRKAAEAGKELEDKLTELQDQLEETTESTEDAAEGASELEKNVEGISRAQKGQIIAQLAQAVGKIADKFREAASEVREFDAEAADSFTQTADRIDTVTTSVSALAMGFAAGGPLGAGVAGVGLLIGGLVNAWKDSEVAAIKAAAEEIKALETVEEAARQASIAASERAAELSSDEIARSIQDQNNRLTDGLKILQDQLDLVRQRRREQEEILKAEDKLTLAQIDEKEAKGEITSVEAAQQRQDVSVGAQNRADEARKEDSIKVAETARKEAQLQAEAFAAAENTKVGIEAKMRAKEQELNKAKETSTGAAAKDGAVIFQDKEARQLNEKTNMAAYRGDKKEAQEFGRQYEARIRKIQEDAKTEVTKLQTEFNLLKTAFDDQVKVVDNQSKTAGDAANNADLKEAAAVSTVQTVDKVSSIEDQARETKNRADEIRRQKEAEDKQRIEREKEAEALKRDQAEVGNRAASLIPKEITGDLERGIRQAREGLKDGDQGGELDALAKLVKELIDIVGQKDIKTSIDIGTLQKDIEKLRTSNKNNRPT